MRGQVGNEWQLAGEGEPVFLESEEIEVSRKPLVQMSRSVILRERARAAI